MIQRGVVQELVEGNAKVAVGGSEGCRTCTSKESCVVISGTVSEEKFVIVENVLGASVGDAVELELPIAISMQVIFVTFMLPVVMLIAGYFITLENGAASGAIGAVSGLAIGMVIALATNRTLAKKPSYRMKMTRIIAKMCNETEVKK